MDTGTDTTTEDRAAEARERSQRTQEHLDAAQEARLIREDGEKHDGDLGAYELVEKAAHSAKGAVSLDDGEKVDAMAWLLADSDESEDNRTETWQFNIGTEEHPQWIDWTIQAVDADTMNSLRQRARGRRSTNRAQRRERGGQEDFDVTMFNLFMVAAATLDPNLVEAAAAKSVGSADPLEGPVLLLKHKFRGKPGIVDQIAAKVMLFSGYDEEDARRATPEAVMVRAAGNS